MTVMEVTPTSTDHQRQMVYLAMQEEKKIVRTFQTLQSTNDFELTNDTMIPLTTKITSYLCSPQISQIRTIQEWACSTHMNLVYLTLQ